VSNREETGTSGNGGPTLGQITVLMSEGVQYLEEAEEIVDYARKQVGTGAVYLAQLLADLGTKDRPQGLDICRNLARLAGVERRVEDLLAGN